MQLVSWVEDLVSEPDFKPSVNRAKMLRSQLWSIGNQVIAKNHSEKNHARKSTSQTSAGTPR